MVVRLSISVAVEPGPDRRPGHQPEPPGRPPEADHHAGGECPPWRQLAFPWLEGEGPEN